MKRTTRLLLVRTTLRQLDVRQLGDAAGASNACMTLGCPVIGTPGTIVINPTIRQTGTSVISAGGGH